MQKRGFVRLVLAAFLCLTLQASAATPAKTLPERVDAHISIQSVGKLKRNLFRLIDASTKRTKNHVPVEFLEVMSQMAIPVPLDIWKSDEPTHAVFVRDGNNANLVMVFAVESFDELVGSLEDAEWMFGETDANGGYESVLPVVLPNGKSMLMVNLGGGKAALADFLADVAVVVNDADWKPAHESTADISVNIAINGDGVDFAEKFSTSLEQSFEKFAQAFEEAGVTREAGEGMLRLAQKYIPLVGDEVNKATNALIELTFESDRVLVDAGVCFADGAYMKTVMEHMEKQSEAESKLTAGVPGKPLSVAVNAPPDNVLPDVDKIFPTLLDDVTEEFPSQKQELRDSYRRIREAGMGTTVTSNYLMGGKQVQYTVAEVRDPQASYEGLVANITALGKMMTGFFADSDESIELVVKRHEIYGKYHGELDGLVWHSFAPVPKNAEKFQQLLRRLNELNRNMTMTMQFDPDMRIHVAPLVGSSAVVIAVGTLNDDDFLALLQETGKKGKEGQGWFAAPSAEKVLADLDGMQFARALVDPDGAFFLFATQIAHEDSRRLAPGAANPSFGVLERMAAQTEKNDAYSSIGVGADDGWLLLRLSVPAKAVNAIILDYEKFQSLLREEMRKPAAPSAGDASDEKAPEGEEVVLEADDDAA